MSAEHDLRQSPRWMGRWLVAAGIYNCLWGGAMIIAPIATLGVLGVRPESTELWPQLWACIGMIVGVYGVGYFLAASDPARHWPIVLVGLLGKVLGPIGFVDAALKGLLPWSMGVTIVTNDLLWWIPFGMILWHAAQRAQPAASAEAISLEQAIDRVVSDDGRPLRDVTDERPTLVVLLRHSGCTFCRETIADLAKWQGAIGDAGLNLAVVGLASTTEGLRSFGVKHGLKSAMWFADPERALYRALELKRGTFLQLFGPSVWWGGIRAALGGHGIGKLEGDGFQLPGAFVIHRGRVVRAHRHASAADRPDLAEFACSIS